MGRIRTRTCLALAACVVCGLLAAPAQASFHLMKIREVFIGTNANPSSAFIELQMTAPGQNLVAGHPIDFYMATGGAASSRFLPNNVSNGGDQRTVLIGDTGVAGADEVIPGIGTTLHSFAGPGGGAVCWRDGVPPDCVAWGNFTGASVLPAPGAGTPVLSGGIPDGSSITRSICAGVPTQLEDTDDTNNSAADFAQTTPTPRNNATAPSEVPCAGVDGNAPNTKIKKRPKNRSSDTSPTFKFKSTEAGSTFKCKLDHKPFKKCHSPKTYHGLDPGKHTFKVEAIDADGNVDKSPAKDKFKVLP